LGSRHDGVQKRVSLLTDPEAQLQNLPNADVLLLYPDHPLPVLQQILTQVQPRLVLATYWEDIWRSRSQPLRPRPALPRRGFSRRVNLLRFCKQVQ
jgi:hypothetical protein